MRGTVAMINSCFHMATMAGTMLTNDKQCNLPACDCNVLLQYIGTPWQLSIGYCHSAKYRHLAIGYWHASILYSSWQQDIVTHYIFPSGNIGCWYYSAAEIQILSLTTAERKIFYLAARSCHSKIEACTKLSLSYSKQQDTHSPRQLLSEYSHSTAADN